MDADLPRPTRTTTRSSSGTTARRRLHQGDQHRDVEIEAGTTGRLPAQRHAGENIGETPTHVPFAELQEGAGPAGDTLGPA
jgi:hypothetical protein